MKMTLVCPNGETPSLFSEGIGMYQQEPTGSDLNGLYARGYADGIPDEAPVVLENAHWAPSYRRLCKVLLRNDWWCKGLGLTQPKSEAYGRYLEIKRAKKSEVANDPNA